MYNEIKFLKAFVYELEGMVTTINERIKWLVKFDLAKHESKTDSED